MPEKYKYLIGGLLIGSLLVFSAGLFKEPEPKPEAAVEQPYKANNNKITGYQIPEGVNFAGEPVPISRPEVRERLEREILVNAFWHSNSVILIKRANKWLTAIDSILVANEVPSDFKYLAVAESGLDNVVSPSNAVGFWQFLGGTAKDFGLTVNRNVDQRYDPILATVAATKYLKQSKEKFGTWTMVAASYNLGMSGAQKIIDNQKPETYYDLHMSEEPSRYLYRVLALKNMLENQSQFGFEIPNNEMYFQPKTKKLVISEDIGDLHAFALEQGTSYSQLRYLNPWIRNYQIDVPKGKTFEIKLPKK